MERGLHLVKYEPKTRGRQRMTSSGRNRNRSRVRRNDPDPTARVDIALFRILGVAVSNHGDPVFNALFNEFDSHIAGTLTEIVGPKTVVGRTARGLVRGLQLVAAQNQNRNQNPSGGSVA